MSAVMIGKHKMTPEQQAEFDKRSGAVADAMRDAIYELGEESLAFVSAGVSELWQIA